MVESTDDTTYFDNQVKLVKSVFPNTDEIFTRLQKLEWYAPPFRKGKNSKRSLCFHGVEKTEVGREVCDWIGQWFNERLISVEIIGIFGNNYPDGCATLPRHQDKYGCDILSISFGASRRFHFADGYKGKIVQPTFQLDDGDVFLFKKEMNDKYWHGINKQDHVKGRRINLTCFVKFPGLSPFVEYTDEELALALQFHE